MSAEIKTSFDEAAQIAGTLAVDFDFIIYCLN